MGSTSKPRTPKAKAEPDKSAAEAAERERKRLRGTRGRASTMLGGPSTGAPTALGTSVLGGY
jgi:hypothetical protein